MVVFFYFAGCALALMMLASFLIKSKKVDSLFIMFSIMVTVNCLGRYMLSVSTNLEMAIWANKFLYLGGCFAPVLTVFILARLCEHVIPTWLKVFLLSFATIVYGFVLTIGKMDIYYKSVELAEGNGYHYLVKEYGPFHTLYPVMMIMYAAIMLYYLCYAIRKRNQLSFRIVVTLCVGCFSIIFLYILERLLNSNISFLSVGYLIAIALLINYFDRLNIYDMSSNIISTIEKMNEYGYIVFDEKYRYINANAYIKSVFPEINEFSVDREVPDSDSFFHREIMDYLFHWIENTNEKKIIAVQDKYYDLNVRVISYGRREKLGYLLEFVDRTMEVQYHASLEKEVEEKTAHILHIKDMLVLGMADMVESRDKNTGGHIKRTSAVVKIFARELQNYCDVFHFDHDFLKKVEKAAPMHDLGKIAIDDEILRKPGKFTDEEFEKMKKHAEEGTKIITNIFQGVEDESFVEISKNVANYHHEKWNGKGYPLGLSGEEIPMEARIMALADVFDALVSKRCYKDAFSYDEAFGIIEESLGQHFDPELGKVFIQCRPELEKIYDETCKSM